MKRFHAAGICDCCDAPPVEVLAVYELCVIGPPPRMGGTLEIFPSTLRETEENLTDLLPDGYEVRIKEVE
jgi:hypothetical protein